MPLISDNGLTVRAYDGNGDPVAGAVIAAYEAGTTTPVTIYADADLTVLHDQIANAAGVFAPAYLASGAYKLDVTDPDTAASLPGFPIDDYLIGSSELYSSLSDLIASTEVARGEGAIWVAGEFRYKEAASGATDHHITTAGGVKLYAIPSDPGVWDIEQIGGAADASTDNSPIAQKLFDYFTTNGGGTIRFADVGTYLMRVTGDNSHISGHKLCCEITGDNTAVIIGKNSTVKLADGEQTDATGSVDIFSGDIARANIRFHVDGVLTNNKDAMPDWTGGYGQAGAGGCCVLFKGGHTGGYYEITGSGEIGHSYSNPVDLGADTSEGGEFYLAPGMTFRNVGEGLEVVGFAKVFANKPYLLLDGEFEMAGDALEFARCGIVDVIGAKVIRAQAEGQGVTGITQANPAAVTVAGHGYSTGDTVKLADIAGMTEINHYEFAVTVVDADTFTLDGCDSTAYGAFVASDYGRVAKMLGTAAASALEFYGSRIVTVQGAVIENWTSLVSIGAPSSGPPVLAGQQYPRFMGNDIFARGITGANALGDGYQSTSNPHEMVFNNLRILDSPDCNPILIQGDGDIGAVVFNDALFTNCKKVILDGSRPFVWNGGGNVNSTKQCFDIQSSAAGKEYNFDLKNVDFSNSGSGIRMGVTGGGTAILKGSMHGCKVSEFGDWPATSPDVDYTGLSISDCLPSSDEGTSEPMAAFCRRYTRDSGGGTILNEAPNPCADAEFEIINNKGGGTAITLEHNNATDGAPLFNTSGVDDALADQTSRRYRFRNATQAAIAGFYEV